MKKIILAAAVASVLAPVAAIADAKLYGDLRMSYIAGGDKADVDSVVNNASRIGLKGTVGDDGGLTGFYHIQMGVKTDKDGGEALTNRFAFAGVKGGFGKVVVGRMSSPYKMAGLKTDPFYDTSAGLTDGGANFGLSGQTNGFINNTVGYVSPKLGGAFTINAVGFLGNDDANGSTKAGPDDVVNIGVNYAKGPLTASVQHLTEIDATRLAGTYKAGALGVGLSVEDVDGDDYMYLSGTYKVAPKTKLAASYGDIDLAGVTGDGFSLGAFHNIAKKTQVSAIYSKTELTPTGGASADGDVFAIGFSQKF